MKLENWQHLKSDHHEDLCAPNQQPEQLDNLTGKKIMHFKFLVNICYQTISVKKIHIKMYRYMYKYM